VNKDHLPSKTTFWSSPEWSLRTGLTVFYLLVWYWLKKILKIECCYCMAGKHKEATENHFLTSWLPVKGKRWLFSISKQKKQLQANCNFTAFLTFYSIYIYVFVRLCNQCKSRSASTSVPSEKYLHCSLFDCLGYFWPKVNSADCDLTAQMCQLIRSYTVCPCDKSISDSME
jgi:hypothetical protein